MVGIGIVYYIIIAAANYKNIAALIGEVKKLKRVL
jgi:hypothetical protein